MTARFDGPIRALFDVLAPSRARLAARDEAILADQLEIAQIPAPTGLESRRARWMAVRLAAAGLQTAIDEAGNVVATRHGATDAAPVVVCAHLDTVFPADVTLGVHREAGRWIGPGIGDNARGLATMLALAEELSGQGAPSHPIIFAATTGEEGMGDLRGARHLFETAGRGAHAAIAIDGAGDERIVASALGSRRYRVEFSGPGGHSWAAFGVPNAVHAAGGLVARLAALPLALRPRATLTVSRIGGGSAVNAIPAQAWIDVDIRSTSEADLARLERQLHAAAQDALFDENARRRPGSPLLALGLTSLGDRPAGDVAEATPLVQTALGATRCIGRTPEMAIASTDANIPISLGVPAVAIGGGGRGGDTHTPHEWFDNADGSRGIARALVLVAAVAGL